MILESKNIEHTLIDIAEPGKETEKEFMQKNSTSKGVTSSDLNPRNPLPPQFFNDEKYCGDYEGFDLANEIDQIEVFLKLAEPTVAEEPAIAECGEGDGAAEATEQKDKANGDHADDGSTEPANDDKDGEKEV